MSDTGFFTRQLETLRQTDLTAEQTRRQRMRSAQQAARQTEDPRFGPFPSIEGGESGRDGASLQEILDLQRQLPELQLERFAGDIRVPLTPAQRETIDLTRDLISGKFGQFRTLLSGEPDLGLLQRAVIDPAERQLRQTTLPQIADIFAGGPGFQTGARREAQAESVRQVADFAAQARFQQTQRAQELGLQAVQLLPTIFSIQDVERQNEISNVMREIGVHFQNQGLTVQEFQGQIQTIGAALTIASFDFSKFKFAAAQDQLAIENELREAELQFQKDALDRARSAGKFGIFGQIAGGVAGFVLGGPLGAVAGAQIGGGIGAAVGGAPQVGFGQVSAGARNLSTLLFLQEAGFFDKKDQSVLRSPETQSLLQPQQPFRIPASLTSLSFGGQPG